MKRLYSSARIEIDLRIALPPDESHHAKSVLRLKSGEEIELINGTGRLGQGKIEIEGEDVFVTIKKIISAPSNVKSKIILEAPLLKPKTMEILIQKATELGVDEIQPVVFSRSIQVSPSKYGHLRERWEKISIQALKQSERLQAPKIENPITFIEQISKCHNHRFVFIERRDRAPSTVKMIDTLYTEKIPLLDNELRITIGPEGGFESSEVNQFSDLVTFISLGDSILRSETAVIAALVHFTTIRRFKMLDKICP